MFTNPPPKIKEGLEFLGQLWSRAATGFLEKRLVLKSAALSYATVLSLVPLLAITFSVTNFVLTRAEPAERQQIIDEVLVKVIPQIELLEERRIDPIEDSDQYLLPTREGIRRQVVHFLEISGSGKIGGLGIAFFVFLALSMLITIEHTFNDIWEIQKGRPWFRRITLYWSVLTLGLIFLVIALGLTGRWQATALAQQLQQLPYVTRITGLLTPFIIFWVGLSFAFITLPNTKVSIPCAITGGIFTGTLLQLNNLFNTMYIFQVASYEQSYGGLGILPILLVGLYVFWLIILSGALFTHSLEEIIHLRDQTPPPSIDS